jgi:glycerol-3-phosphate dehydrogenase (NAD(P)+)
MSGASPTVETGPSRFAVLGAGAWGTALARLLGRNGHAVRLWARSPEHAAAIAAAGANARHLPGAMLGPRVHPTSDLASAVDGADAVVLAVPVRATDALLAALPTPRAVVSCAKGFVDGRLTRLSERVQARHPGVPVAALSGPNLAAEIGRDRPAAATAASRDAALAHAVQGWFTQPSFRVYRSADLIGVEVSGALKNVIALAAGMSDALGLGDNTKAALVTRGLAELVRLGTRLGGEARTFYGLAGLGDLMATCSSAGSRNHQAGERLARGATLAELEASGLTAEGLTTVAHVVAYARAAGLDLPLTSAVHAVVHGGTAPEAALLELMTRQPTEE